MRKEPTPAVGPGSGRGGKRAGAGRPKGSETKKTRAIADAAARKGITPLEYMLQVMRHKAAPMDLRFDAAKAAAPYIHPRLQAIEHTGEGGGPIVFQRIERTIVDPKAVAA